ncbi:hypothetical protein BOC36_01925 [Burkholderia pseudomallei]|nr:hypothetical protein BOC36_01925 [Burkholderia pseudomallei]
MTEGMDQVQLAAVLAELDREETPEDQKRWETAGLITDIRQSISLSQLNPDEDETHEEKARRIMAAFVERVATTGDVPKELLQWAAIGFARFLEEKEPLEHAFRVADRRHSQHQITDRKRLHVINAYRHALAFHQLKFERNARGVREALQVDLTKDALIDAEWRAYIAYHDGNEPAAHEDWERRFRDTILPILKNSGDYVPRSTTRGRSSKTIRRR